MKNLNPIRNPYLICIQIKCYCDQNNRRFLDQLWYKDVKEHLLYLKNLTIACPCQYGEIPADAVSLDSDKSFAEIKFVDLPSVSSLFEALIYLPITIARIWQTIRQVDIVHSSVIGWPLPWNWFITPIVQIHGKYSIIIVESATWRLSSDVPSNLPSKIRAYIFEKLACWSLNKADLAIFTQEEYKKSLLTNAQKKGYVIHASWIDEANIISENEATQLWRTKVVDPILKVLFVGRLTVNKGVKVLLEAMKILNQEEISMTLDILGQGVLLDECKEISEQLSCLKSQLLGTIPYDNNFFKLLRNYHLVIVPSLSDEQPRIVYDAYSQAIPVIASDTPGLRDCIQHGLTGLLLPSNDTMAIVNSLKSVIHNLNQLWEMGMNSLKIAHNMTHQKMHQKRWELLLDSLALKKG